MNLPNFKDVLKIVLGKLSIFRRNVPLLISVIIAFVGILLFVPTQLLSSGLKKEIQQKSISPLLNPLERLEPVSKSDLETSQKNFDKISKDANSISTMAVETVERELLSDKIFKPNSNDANSTFSQSLFYDFGRKYRDNIDKFISSHNARNCPTETELKNELKASGVDTILQQGGGTNMYAYNNMENQQNIEGMMAEQICKKRAMSTYVYIDPMSISGYGFWKQYNFTSWDEDIANCWFSQLAYWVIEDVFDTIVTMNDGQESLVNAPIKRLMRINFSDFGSSATSSSTIRKVTAQGKYTDRPQYVLSNVDIPKETPTGRYSNDNYDVIHFKVAFVIRTKDFMRVIQELCSAKEHKYIDQSNQTHIYKHNQITVLDTSLRSVNMNSEQHNFYWYGEENVSVLELTCEYLFNVKGYLNLMPEPVKKMFN